MKLISHDFSPRIRSVAIAGNDAADVTVRLDLSTVQQFKQQIGAAIGEAQNVILDLSNVAFVDSSGLGAILSCVRDLTASGGDLKICSVQQRVMVMFDLVRLPKIIGIHKDVHAAIAAFQEMQH
jgi:anti-sigma B factor antagonist